MVQVQKYVSTLYIMILFMRTQDIYSIAAQVYAEKPQMDIHNFIGTFTRVSYPYPIA